MIVNMGLNRYGVETLQDEVTGLKCLGTKRYGICSNEPVKAYLKNAEGSKETTGWRSRWTP